MACIIVFDAGSTQDIVDIFLIDSPFEEKTEETSVVCFENASLLFIPFSRHSKETEQKANPSS